MDYTRRVARKSKLKKTEAYIREMMCMANTVLNVMKLKEFTSNAERGTTTNRHGTATV